MSALAVVQPAPNMERLIALAVNAVQSENTRRAYFSALRGYLGWWEANGRPALTRETVHAHRTALQQAGGKAGRINQALQAIAKLATEAEACGAISYATLASIQSVERIRQRGAPAGNWLDESHVVELLRAPADSTLMGLRDRAVLGLLIGTALRRTELARLTVDQFVQREGRWVILDSAGKGGRVRTVPVHDLAADATLAWLHAAGITKGPLLRSFDLAGNLTERGLADTGIYWIVRTRYAEFGVAPHDLRRTIADIMRKRGAPLEAVQSQLGHQSITTTMRYLSKMDRLKRGDAGVDYWQPTAT